MPVKTDANNKVQSDEMRRVSRELNDKNIERKINLLVVRNMPI